METMIEQDWNSHPNLVDENGSLHVLKVSNFRLGKTADERMYDVSIASGPLYACHCGFTISVKETNKTKFLRDGYRITCAGPGDVFRRGYEAKSPTPERLAKRRQDIGKNLVESYFELIKKETEQWEAMWNARSFHVIVTVQSLFGPPLVDLRDKMLRQIREDWLADAH